MNLKVLEASTDICWWLNQAGGEQETNKTQFSKTKADGKGHIGSRGRAVIRCRLRSACSAFCCPRVPPPPPPETQIHHPPHPDTHPDK